MRKWLMYLIAAATASGLMVVTSQMPAGATGSDKVWVCKYVGTPGVDERLQTGQNPISVSVNAIDHNSWDGTVPGWFSDAHDRSYVLGYDNGEEEPDVSECPQPPVVNNPSADVEYSCEAGEQPTAKLNIQVDPDLDPLDSWTLTIPSLNIEVNGTDTSLIHNLPPIPVGSYGWSMLLRFRALEVDYDSELTGTLTVSVDCTQDDDDEASFSHLVFCSEAGGVNGPVPLSGTANGVAVSFAAGESKFFPYDSNGKLHLILKDGDDVVFDQVLSLPEGVGCDFSASFSGSADCKGAVSGTLSVNTDGISELPSYRVNGGSWVKMSGSSVALSGLVNLVKIEVGYPDAAPQVQASLTVVGPPAGSCVPPLPQTGGSSGGLLAAGSVLSASGFALVMLSRRRKLLLS